MGKTDTGMPRQHLGLNLQKNPILVDLDGENECTESEPGSVQHPSLIEDRDDTPQDHDTELESDSGPSAGIGLALLRGSTTRTRQQSRNHSREGSPAALSRTQDAGGQDESVIDKRGVHLLPPTTVQSLEGAPCGDTPIEPVAMAREASPSIDATLTDRTDSCGHTPADETRTILWRHVAFHIVRSLHDGGPKDLLPQITLPQTEGGDESLRMKSFVIQHDPNQLFDILGYLLALAIHDDVFATGLRDIEEVYRIDIPPHMNGCQINVIAWV